MAKREAIDLTTSGDEDDRIIPDPAVESHGGEVSVASGGTCVTAFGSVPPSLNAVAGTRLIETAKSTGSVASTTSRSIPTVPYSLLAKTFATMAGTSKRNSKLQALKELFMAIITKAGGIGGCTAAASLASREADARLLTTVIELTLGKLFVTSEANGKTDGVVCDVTVQTEAAGSALLVSGSLVSEAIKHVTGTSRQQMRQSYRILGDLGDVAAEYFLRKPLKSFFVMEKGSEEEALQIETVHQFLVSIATVPSGKGSQASRRNLLVKLLRQCKEKDEIRFLVRTLLGNMRLGATLKSVLAGLAMAVKELETATASSKLSSDDSPGEVIQRLQKVYHVCPRLHQIAQAVLLGGISYAEKVCSIAVGFAIEPMLANPAQSLDQVHTFTDGQEAVAEWKYDGVRCQAHWDGTEVRLFSRHLLDNTLQYPDAVKYLLDARKGADISSFVLDAEIVGVAVDDTGYRLLPFQDLSTRRKVIKSIGENTSRVQIRVYCFDLIYLNGESLLNSPLWSRQSIMRAHFNETPGFAFATSVYIPSYSEDLLRKTLTKAVAEGSEGLMIKLLGKPTASLAPSNESRSFGYEAGTRSRLWLKLKKDYISGDSIDVVPIGAWYGNGRKAQKGFLSPVLLAVYDEDEGTFHSISRCMSFSDAMYRATRDFYFRGKPYPDGVGVDTELTNAKDSVGMPGDEVKDPVSLHEERQEILVEDATRQSLPVDGPEEDEEEHVHCHPHRPSNVITNEKPSIWFHPLEVWEVSFADLSLSQVHTAAAEQMMAPDGRGIALRFPRFIRRRLDKTVEQATTCRQIADLYAGQSKIMG